MTYVPNYGTHPKKSKTFCNALTFNKAKNGFLKQTKFMLKKDLITSQKVGENFKFCNVVRSTYSKNHTNNMLLSDFDKHIAKLLMDRANDKELLHGAVRFVNFLKTKFDYTELPYTRTVLINCGAKPKSRKETNNENDEQM